MHPFQKYLANYTAIPTKDWQLIKQTLIPKTVKRNELLLEEGKICRHLFFLENGLLRFFVWKDGQDITKYFTHPPYLFTSQRSFSLQKPARESIQALEDSQLWLISKSDAEQLLELKSWSTFIRKLVQEVQYFTEGILEEVQNETAEKRYQQMLQNGDVLLSKVPLKHLASYLGIAPQSLSRIRKKMQ